MTGALAVLEVAEPYDALGRAVLATLEREALPAFLMGRRWFGGKGAPPRAVRIGALVPLAWEGGRAALVRLDVELGDRGTAHYQLPLAVVNGVGEGVQAIARVESPLGSGLLVDAANDVAFRRMLADAFAAGGRTFEGDGFRLAIEAVGDASALATAGEGRVGSAEQSNTSIVFGDAAILKLFRRIEPGQHPDVELTHALTVEGGFAHTPALLGTITLERGAERETTGMLQRYAAGSTDAWRWLLDAARAGGPALGALAGDLRTLGAVTREMHDTLAAARGPGLAAERATRDDVARWAGAARRMAESSLQLLARGAVRLEGEARAGADALLAARDERLREIDAIARGLGDDAGARIRHHGDYHLGQVLRTPDARFLVIDFEGEPARPLAERRERHSALRDVAGMLRSFAYAAATVEAESRGASGGREWERDAREAFLDGYFARGDSAFLPRDRGHVDGLLSLFEAEKAWYELAYELNNRPDWAWIPLRGLAGTRP